MQCEVFEFFSKKVAQICESDLKETTDGSCDV